jgi:hypothetical protein
MQLAVTGLQAPTQTTQYRDYNADSTSANLRRRGTWFSAPLSAAPRTKVEQYWAARALVAETLLSARVQHQGELTGMRLAEEEKRAVSSASTDEALNVADHHKTDIAALVHANDQRQNKLERFLVSGRFVISIRAVPLSSILLPANVPRPGNHRSMPCGSIRVCGLRDDKINSARPHCQTQVFALPFYDPDPFPLYLSCESLLLLLPARNS